MAKEVCTSCKKRVAAIESTTRFPCPKCHKAEIVRCGQCRRAMVRYTCQECGFEGPN